MEVHDQSGDADNRFKPRKQVRSKIPKLISDLCDYSDAYVVVKGKIIVKGANNADRWDRSLAFRNLLAVYQRSTTY